MASLKVKALSQLPIGTPIELTYAKTDVALEQVIGTITDSDFSESFEITMKPDETITLDYQVVRVFKATKLAELLKNLPIGAHIRYSYGNVSDRTPNREGTVQDNDGEQSIMVRLKSGEEECIDYSVFQSLLIVQSPGEPKKQTVPAEPKREEIRMPERDPEAELKRPEILLNYSDAAIKQTFELLIKGEKGKFTSAYEMFKQAIRTNNKVKIQQSASRMRDILNAMPKPSGLAARFCACILRRADVYDYALFLVGSYYEEAAKASFSQGYYSNAAAYAVLALKGDNIDSVNELFDILLYSTAKAEDVTGIRYLDENTGDRYQQQIEKLLNTLLRLKGMSRGETLPKEAALDKLSEVYRQRDIIAEINRRTGIAEPPSEEKAAEKIEEKAEEKAEEREAEAVVSEPPETVQEKPEPSYIRPRVTDNGKISLLSSDTRTGEITNDYGSIYEFSYDDVKDELLRKMIEGCTISNPSGTGYKVAFSVKNDRACDIEPDCSYVDLGRAIAADNTRADTSELAFEVCCHAFNAGDNTRAVFDIIKYAMRLYNKTQDPQCVQKALELYEEYQSFYPKDDAFAILDVARCYVILKKYDRIVALGQQVLDIPGNTAKQRIPLLSSYLKMIKTYYEESKDKALLEQMLQHVETLKREYSNNFTYDSSVHNVYNTVLLPLEIYAECELEMLEEATRDYAKLSDSNTQKQALGEMLAQLKAKLSPELDDIDQPLDDVFPEEENEADEAVVPYSDNDGWKALGLSKSEVIEYALSLQGDARVPEMLVYLRAAAMLNREIMPVYQIVALAADDPMEPHDYNLDTIVKIMDAWDGDYETLNDRCMAAIFLLTVFTHGRRDDYNLSAYWSGIGVKNDIPALDELYNCLEQFRKMTGCAMGIYAHIHQGGSDSLQEQMRDAITGAEAMYAQHVTSPYSNSFFPLVKTKQSIFSQDSFLAQMLDHVRKNDRDALMAQQGDFIDRYLKNAKRVSAEFINRDAVDEEIDEAFARVIQDIHNTKRKVPTQKLVGSRRTSLLNAIMDSLNTICRWYELFEQQEEISLKTDENDRIYAEALNDIRERIQRAREIVQERMSTEDDPQGATGLYMIAFTLTSLENKLKDDGGASRKKYMYADFLRSNYILLNEDFMPDLTSTFCALPDFNILRRIRQHIESPKLSFEEQVVKIFGPDKSANNYGTANRIIEYLNATRETVDVSIPQNADEYIAQTEQQIDMRYREFREEYALAMSYGRIMRTDDFCYNLRDTIGYWFRVCKANKNFGFFVSLVQHAENMINNSAKNYQERLTMELEAIIENTPNCFSEHPDYEEAIRTQIANQRFSVAEDWMTRIRLDDFSFTIERPEALDYLAIFLDSYPNIYRQVQDLSRPLNTLVSPRAHTFKDSKGGQRLIENWLTNGGVAGDRKITQVMWYLGWRNILVTRRNDVDGIELYACKRESNANRLTVTSHPIAAFGSDLYNSDDNTIYVACLYGNYDCDRLCAKIHILDRVRGNKIILVDAALGVGDRRALARELKRSENGFNYIYLIVDRVLVSYIATHYREDQVNNMLMAMGMPFSYAQPYVVDSAKTMPPELFIGRKTELHNIRTEKEGVNLIYGGRQLGKTALLRKALSDVDGYEDQRAALIDIKSKNCAQAARLVSEKLIDLNITPGVEPTEDWDVLCRNISNRLRSDEDRISYLLLLLDEADSFISDCANLEYSPLVALKDVQASFPGRFKYVLAGLKDIVRFNRSVALGNNAVITHMSSMKITPFNTPEAEELLMKPLSYLGFSLPDKVIVSQILSTCNYFPGLIQLYAKNLIRSVQSADYAGYSESNVPPYVITESHLRKTLTNRKFTDEIHDKYESTLLLDDNFVTIALLLAFLYYTEPEKIPNGFTVSDLHAVITDLGLSQLNALNEETIEALIFDLRDLNILRNVTADSYLFASKNFRDLLGSSEQVTAKLEKKG